MTLEAIFTPFTITLAILAVSAIFFMRGKVRPDIVAICSLLALLLFGILNPNEALAGFSNSVVIMMVGLFIVGAGIFRTGLAKMISSRIIGFAGTNQNTLFLSVMLVTAFVGAFVSNTGTVAVMMPIVMSMAAGAGVDPKRYLMPMAFASSMGLFTLISTPPNLVIQDALVGAGEKPLGFFAFAPVGAVVVVVGVTLLFFLSRLLDRKSDKAGDKQGKKEKTIGELVAEYNLIHRTFRLTVPSDSELVGKTIKELKINTIYGVSIGQVIHSIQGRFRKSIIEEIAGPDTIIKAHDTLYALGNRENIERFAEANRLTVESYSDEQHHVHSQDSGVAELFIMPNSKLINHTITDSRFRELFHVNVLGIKRHGEYDINNIRNIKLHSGDALLVQGRWSDIMNLDSQEDDLVLVGTPEKEAAKVTLDRKAPIAATIMLAMIAVMVLDIIPSVAAVLSAAILMVLTGCLRNMEEAYQSINWSSVVLIGAMIPMATAFEKTGITAQISKFMLHGLGDIGSLGVLAMLYFCTSLLTMFLSNTATAVLFAPIALAIAAGIGDNPIPYLFAVAVAASMSFASPFSTPPNALVMSAGRYTFMDYVRVGLPLQIVIGIVMVFILPLIFPFR